MAKKVIKEETIEKAVKTAKEVSAKAEKAAKEVSEKAEKTAKEVSAKAEKAAKEVSEKVTETAKKTAAKAAAKKEIKTSLSVQYMGKEVSEKDIIALVKKEWTAKKNKIGDIKTMDLYVKVEENKAYYVINGTESGYVEI